MKTFVRSMVNSIKFVDFLLFNVDFDSILAIVLLGEPVQWERSLQVITDLLLTDGNPNVIPSEVKNGREHIPLIACNRDLVFKAAADLPRFGHGAFLTCLEALYKVKDRNTWRKKDKVKERPFLLTFRLESEWKRFEIYVVRW